MSGAAQPARIQRDHAPSAHQLKVAKPNEAAFRQHRDFVTHWHRLLDASEVTVWHYLWSVAHRDGRYFYVGTDKIAERAGLHKRTVRRCIDVLESRGLVEAERRERYGRGRAIGYRVPARLPPPPATG
jgi:hypothetical protein